MDKRARIGFGIANVLIGVIVAACIFRLLPSRWWVVDGGAVIVSGLLVASGGALLKNARMAPRLTRYASIIVLLLGLAVFAALVLTASWIQGVYGPVGRGGAIIFALVALMVLPYLVVLPAVELLWIGPALKKADAKSEA
jgi:hypothetical protein